MNLSQLFHDIEPIPQDDGPHPVCAIDYPEKFVEAMNYLRALIDIDEHSGMYIACIYMYMHIYIILHCISLTYLILFMNQPINQSSFYFRSLSLQSVH